MSRKYKYCPCARYAAIVGVFFECFCFSGIIFGWPYFNQILQRQQFWKCPPLNESAIDNFTRQFIGPQHNASGLTHPTRSISDNSSRQGGSSVDFIWTFLMSRGGTSNHRDGQQVDDSMSTDVTQLACDHNFIGPQPNCSNSSMLELLCQRDGLCLPWARCFCATWNPPYTSEEDCQEPVHTLKWLHHSGHVLFYVLLLPAGLFHDRFGTMKTRCVGILCFSAATLVVSFSNQERNGQIFIALVLFAISGAFVLLPSLPISNLFLKFKSTIVGLYCAASECSAVVFFLIHETYLRGVKMQLSFMFLTAGALPVLVNTCAFLPTKWIKETDVDESNLREEQTEDVEDKMIRVAIRTSFAIAASEGSLPNENDLIQMAERHTRRHKRRRISLLDTARVLKTELLSRRYLSHWLWISVLHMASECLVHSLQEAEYFIKEGNSSDGYIPLAGLLFCPLLGMLLDLRVGPFDTGGRNFLLAMLLVVLSLTATTAVALAEPSALQQHVALIQVVFRSLTSTCAATFLNAMFMKKYFGTLAGILFASMGLVSLGFFLVPEWILHDGREYVLGSGLFLSILAVSHPVLLLWQECRHVTRRGSTQPCD